MRIIQIVCVVSPDNVYGGPTTVAVNQCNALLAAGHDVTLAAGARGFEGDLPTELDGVPLRLFPAKRVIPGAGFAGLAAPAMLSWLKKAGASAEAIHVHLARDLVTLPAARQALKFGVPVTVQTHGMIDPSSNPLAGPLDAGLTKTVLRRASRVFFLTPVEAEGLRAVAGEDLALEELHNGIDVAGEPTERAGADGSEPDSVEVLYLARLQERKRPLVFVAAAKELAGIYPQARFRIVGPDEGQGDAVQSAIAQTGLGGRLHWDGPASSAASREAMERADIYVLPSVNEPYPMSVLEAMATGLPVIITDTCGLAPAVERGGGGIVVTDEPREVRDAIASMLADPAQRRAYGVAAAQLIRDEFSMGPIVEQLLTAYSGAAGPEHPRGKRAS